ncbi:MULTISPECIES: alpha-hydroxyketone-type quorum-sensing autoinducer synthase [unclassified Cupriavidus]|uniref:alpha-hydroxyketone-type quorum-sensing autoinducer synthase n=1 Tax=unclassified Cupriavidus TaxID=2640874 RepID=UPI001BFFFE0C|nr:MULTISPECIES: alpha-hydroxyketone-type quorum-sensing autoinducer synthase [unclassified Cupriavidus]MCA3186402.1 quorum-sensing autoinducer CAI-1 synthase [Cupriavidus sp.]MCA3189065.1 quorum-sensing autoinducer CAI-1 synthase [Cupriavidus sp.]MCA3198784.1 quorum-sensing autoinducer CAI-1 synthase [Cupriavidus sp.]MCA3201530.1 quorum-sensing autoinducer CAI-1 synthase [Cupriavidus sp.]MCA3209914.1 quorum-sensing autoinducer CAI-1 synthase [Cupriavidus sp.]
MSPANLHPPLTKSVSRIRSAPLPAWISDRMDTHFVDRMEKLWGGEHLLHGRVPGPDALHLSSNDYLCLLGESALVQAQARALLDEAPELLMSSVFRHGDTPQQQVERKLANLMQAEDGLIAQSGWAANVGLVQCIAGPGVPVYIDMNGHASLWEGISAAGAQAVPVRHNDFAHAARQIERLGPGVIMVDAVYSTTGSVAPLEAYVEMAEATGSVLVVDESHSLGTHGPAGGGLVPALGLSERVHFRTASLAKAFAGRAGFVACSTRFKDFFAVEARPAIFSSGLLRHEIAWFDAATDFIARADDRRERLHAITRTTRAAITALGYNISDGSEQIIGLEAGAEPQVMVLRNALQRHGIFGAVFCSPATPKNRALMRLTLHAKLGPSDIDRLIDVLAKIRDEVNLAEWSSTRRAHRGHTRSPGGTAP